MRVFLIVLLAFSLLGCSASINPSNGNNSNNHELSEEEKQRIDKLAKEFVENKEIRKNLQILTDYDRTPDAILRNIEEVDSQITYAHLKKNADKYTGKSWAFTGKILEIYESGEETTARIGIGNYGSEPIWIYAKFTTEFIEKDHVYVVGVLNGTHSYTSQAGWHITIPMLVARAIMKPAEASRLKEQVRRAKR